MSFALVAVEGVLAKPGSLAEQPPIDHGMRLYDALRHQYKMVLQADEPNQAMLLRFLNAETIMGYAYAEPRNSDDHVQNMVSAIDRFRGKGINVTLVVDADPLVVEQAMYKGVQGLLFCHPQFMRPENRPDWEGRQPRSWDQITAEIERQRELSK